MTWLQRYRISNYFKNSIWILPTAGMLLAIVTIRILHSIETDLGWTAGFDPATSMTVLATLASSIFTLIIFVCSALLISVQLASAQLTPRFIGLVFQNPVTKLSLTLFVFTFTFTLAALLRITGTVPMLTAYVATIGSLGSLAVFIFLVNEVGHALRPSGALILIARRGHDMIRTVYPRLMSEPENSAKITGSNLETQPNTTLFNQREGVVLAFDTDGLVSIAQQTDCMIELVPQVGDFIGAGEPLFRIFGKGKLPRAESLYQSVAVGPERTLQQDPGFAFRIMVDIASKGLSPAINDPTTAVLVIDQIQHLLREVGTRHLDDGYRMDEKGFVRLIYRTPGWQDFVGLAVTEIRHFGGNSIQIARRLRAMLESLIQTLPGERTPALKSELELLKKSAVRFFHEVEDLAMADISDLQGVGGKSRK
jgi:uncharacterized membrane protein